MNTLSKSKRVAIWGYGREGRTAGDYIASNYPNIELTVLNDTPLAAQALPEGRFVDVIIGQAAVSSLRGGAYDLVIKSPGISPYREEVISAAATGLVFTSVTNLWFEESRSRHVIAVTGTKGKSTTSSLIHHMLVGLGADVCLLGNGGVPALAEKRIVDYAVLELSSYQITDLHHAPDIAVITNLYPEHAPWHRTSQQYFTDKMRIADFPGVRVVANKDNDRLFNLLHHRNDITWFNDEHGFSVHDDRLYQDGMHVGIPKAFPLKGRHNIENVGAACTVMRLLGLDVTRGVDTLRSFDRLPHRLEEVGDIDGALCVNDSISTIPEATLAAISTYHERDCILIMGGTERGQDYTKLFEFLQDSKVKLILLLPPNGSRILADMSATDLQIPTRLVASLSDATEEAFKQLLPGELLLLSPAAPSFGQFTNFEERGRAFRDLCADETRKRATKTGM